MGGGNSDPVELFVGGNTYEDLVVWQDQLLQAASENPGLVGIDSDLYPTKPQLRLTIDRGGSWGNCVGHQSHFGKSDGVAQSNYFYYEWARI